MAPINLPNGTEVSEIVLPNGQTASEVIAPDGSVVFGNAIPDSAFLRLPLKAGSGTTAEDVIGSNDGTIDSGNWISGTWIDGQALNNDGVVLSTAPEITDTTAWSLAFTIETTSDVSTDERVFEYDDGSLSFGFQINNGNINVRFPNSSTVIAGSVSTNTKYRIFLTYDNGPGSLYLNGSEVTNSVSSAVTSETQGFYWGKQGNGFAPFTGAIDELVGMDTNEPQSVAQDDYNRQPWS